LITGYLSSPKQIVPETKWYSIKIP